MQNRQSRCPVGRNPRGQKAAADDAPTRIPVHPDDIKKAERPEGGGFSRRQLLVGGGVAAGTLTMLGQLEKLAFLPERVAHADVGSAALPTDVQFDLDGLTPPAQTIDGVLIGMGPVNTVFLTARLARRPSRADQVRLENALRTIEATYPTNAAGVITHVSYSVDYFNRLPALLVAAAMPRTLSNGNFVLRRAVAGPTDVAPGARTLELRRPEFTVPLRLENNDVLFTIRGDNQSFVGDVVRWLAGSNSLRGRAVPSPRFDAGMSFTSSRLMFAQVGLPRQIAAQNNLNFTSFVNPFSPMWMGFFDQQVNASAPAKNVTFAGGGGIRLSDARPGDYMDNGSLQHLSHVLLDLQQFYVDGEDQDDPEADHREPFSERIMYMFTAPPDLQEDADPFTDGGGPRNLSTRGAAVENTFRGNDHARVAAQQEARIGHLDGLHRSGRTSTGAPIHQRIDGPGFDAMDTTTGRNTAKLQFSGFFPHADFFARLRRDQASVDLMDEFDLEEAEHGLERFITATRRQNFLIPPTRHRAFPLVEFL